MIYSDSLDFEITLKLAQNRYYRIVHEGCDSHNRKDYRPGVSTIKTNTMKSKSHFMPI
jgi:PP-loop superfamily ATP-utilizing enzyme